MLVGQPSVVHRYRLSQDFVDRATYIRYNLVQYSELLDGAILSPSDYLLIPRSSRTPTTDLNKPNHIQICPSNIVNTRSTPCQHLSTHLVAYDLRHLTRDAVVSTYATVVDGKQPHTTFAGRTPPTHCPCQEPLSQAFLFQRC